MGSKMPVMGPRQERPERRRMVVNRREGSFSHREATTAEVPRLDALEIIGKMKYPLRRRARKEFIDADPNDREGPESMRHIRTGDSLTFVVQQLDRSVEKLTAVLESTTAGEERI